MLTLDCRAQETEIKDHAIISMGRVRTLLQSIGSREGLPTTSQELRAALNQVAAACQARPVAPSATLGGCVARMSDAAWWLRNLRRSIRKENEVIEHGAGEIRRKKQAYTTDHAVKVTRARATANQKTLDGMEVMNEEGEVFNLGEVAGKSVSNPKIRRAELMMRCRGFEETAEYMRHGAQFLTLTCPSRFHRFDGGGKPNKKWKGQTPKDAQEYLCNVWSKIRAAWGRKGFSPYGFRVAEPHHDGCPHWHILLFMPTEQAVEICAIAQDYALRDNPTERGADKHRFTAKAIDASKGTATGYIAKYICKNIDGLKEDGEGMGLDFDSGTSAAVASERVRVWASTWGIRQFQQVGGPSVTVWRELRRLGAADESLSNSQLDLFTGPQNAADRSLWSLFWVLQGGPDVKPKALTLRPLYTTEAGGRYGEDVSRILGVSAKDGASTYALQTRLHTWTVQRAGMADVNYAHADRLDFMDRAAKIAAFLKEAGIPGVQEFNARQGAWTGVNNCTEKEKKGFDFSGFEPETGGIYETGREYYGSKDQHKDELENACRELKWINRKRDQLLTM